MASALTVWVPRRNPRKPITITTPSPFKESTSAMTLAGSATMALPAAAISVAVKAGVPEDKKIRWAHGTTARSDSESAPQIKLLPSARAVAAVTVTINRKTIPLDASRTRSFSLRVSSPSSTRYCTACSCSRSKVSLESKSARTLSMLFRHLAGMSQRRSFISDGSTCLVAARSLAASFSTFLRALSCKRLWRSTISPWNPEIHSSEAGGWSFLPSRRARSPTSRIVKRSSASGGDARSNTFFIRWRRNRKTNRRTTLAPSGRSLLDIAFSPLLIGRRHPGFRVVCL